MMGYRWNNFVSNQRLLCETESRPSTSIVCQRQLQLCGHLARYPEFDPACRVVSVRHNPEWRRAKGCPQSSWLGQVDASCWELLAVWRWLTWGLARGDRRNWRRRVGETTCPSLYVPNDWLIFYITSILSFCCLVSYLLTQINWKINSTTFKHCLYLMYYFVIYLFLLFIYHFLTWAPTTLKRKDILLVQSFCYFIFFTSWNSLSSLLKYFPIHNFLISSSFCRFLYFLIMISIMFELWKLCEIGLCFPLSYVHTQWYSSMFDFWGYFYDYV